MLPRAEVLSQNINLRINGARADDGGDLVFASIYFKESNGGVGELATWP